MQWNTMSKEEKKRRKQEWHLIFALWPRKITRNRNGQNTWAWLQTIGRKYEYYSGWTEGGPVDCHRTHYCSKEDALYYQLGGEEPKHISRKPLGPPPMPIVKPPKK